MKNDIYKNNLKKLSSVTLLPIPRYTYVPNMGTLSQTIPRKWLYLGRLTSKKWSKWSTRLSVERSRVFQNYGWFYEIITTCVP